MDSSQASGGFSRLLTLLDAEPEIASARYIELREKLVRILLWKGCPEVAADSLADSVLDRIAVKLDAGEAVSDLAAYASGVLRFVWLEYLRKSKEVASGDDLPEIAVNDEIADDPDNRLACLRSCMVEICRGAVDQRLIVGYYDTTANEKNKEARRMLAEDLGLSATALRVRACRLRDKLETCINDCTTDVTKSMRSDTNSGEGGR